MTDNGKVTTEVAEQVVEETAAPQEKLWLHPDALRPRDYIRGKEALKDVLKAAGFENCYDLLGGEYMYPWCIWALESRTDPSFTWEQALDRDFWHYRLGDDERPQTPSPGPSGRSGSMSGGNDSTPKRRNTTRGPASAPSST